MYAHIYSTELDVLLYLVMGSIEVRLKYQALAAKSNFIIGKVYTNENKMIGVDENQN